MKIIKGQYRQGDVLITPAAFDETPELKEGNHILAHGEATGHHHRLMGGQVAYFRDAVPGLARAFIGEGGAEIVHEEHSLIPVEPNTSKKVIQQVQYTPSAIVRVTD